MEDKQILLDNINKVHTTEMIVSRILCKFLFPVN